MIRRIRLGFVVVICVVLQTTLFTHLKVDGVAPDVGLVAVLAVAYYDGAESGAWGGCVMGRSLALLPPAPSPSSPPCMRRALAGGAALPGRAWVPPRR